MSQINYFFMCYLLVITAYPIEKSASEDNSELKDEKRYPNGTVVGAYTYNDKEGNPVHVKYFADDSSYGVELKSFKIIDSKYHLKPEKQRKPDLPNMDIAKDADPSTNIKIDKSLQLFEEKTQSKPKSDFEIYMENDMKAEKCGTGKFRVYHDKNKRKTRDAFNPHQAFRFCQQF